MFDWLQQLEFEHPARLYALLVVPLVLYFGVASDNGLSLWRRVVSSLCRGVLIVLLVVAWSGIAHRGPTSERFTVFVTDRSASVESSSDEVGRSIQKAIGGLEAEPVRNVNFGAEPEDRNALSRETLLNIDPMGSNPAAAVLLAAAICPPDRVPQIVLRTDGLQTAENLFEAAQAAVVPIHVGAIKSFGGGEVCLSEIKLLSPVQHGDSVTAEVLVTANNAESGRLTWSVSAVDRDPRGEPESRPQHELAIDVQSGANRFDVELPVAPKGGMLCRVALDGFEDTIADNNARTVWIPPQTERRVALLGTRSWKIPPINSSRYDEWEEGRFPENVSDLSNYDLVIVRGASPKAVKPQNIEALEQFVRGGGGLLVMGDNSTFGLDAYRNTALERLLPVRATEEVAVSRPTLAMLLVIDKSKSMEDDNRLALAKEAAKRTVDLDLLTPQDKVGVLAFGNTSEWISPIVPCDNKAKLKQQIDGLTAQGQTNMFPALQRAYLALTEAHADRRHVILLTDGVPSPGDFDAIAAQMAEAGITVSTVSIGAGADQLILKDISRIAGGRHIHCEAAEELTEKLVEEARSAAKTERQQHEITVYRQLPDLDVASAPPLAGYVLTSPKPQAELLLLAGPGDPLLAWWRYGAGAAAAFTSTGGGEWGQAWERWNGNAKFWSRVAELVARQPLPPDYNVEVERRGAICRATIDIVNADATFLNGADVELTASLIDVDKMASREEFFRDRMLQVAPGRYAVQLKLPRLGAYLLDIRWQDAAGRERHAQHGVTWDYPDELQLAPADENLLRNVAAVSGGTYDPTPEQISASTQRTAERVTPLWRCLILAGLIVFVVEVGVRHQ